MLVVRSLLYRYPIRLQPDQIGGDLALPNGSGDNPTTSTTTGSKPSAEDKTGRREPNSTGDSHRLRDSIYLIDTVEDIYHTENACQDRKGRGHGLTDDDVEVNDQVTEISEEATRRAVVTNILESLDQQLSMDMQSKLTIRIEVAKQSIVNSSIRIRINESPKHDNEGQEVIGSESSERVENYAADISSPNRYYII